MHSQVKQWEMKRDGGLKVHTIGDMDDLHVDACVRVCMCIYMCATDL